MTSARGSLCVVKSRVTNVLVALPCFRRFWAMSSGIISTPMYLSSSSFTSFIQLRSPQGASSNTLVSISFSTAHSSSLNAAVHSTLEPGPETDSSPPKPFRWYISENAVCRVRRSCRCAMNPNSATRLECRSPMICRICFKASTSRYS